MPSPRSLFVRGFVYGATTASALAYGFLLSTEEEDIKPVPVDPKVKRASEILRYGAPDRGPAVRYYENHVLCYDQARRTPIWVAEHFNSQHLQGPANRKHSKFRPDPSVYPMFTAHNEDYWKSGWSRGHMAPAGDNKFSQEAMNDTFLLSNIVPQNLDNNAGFWNRFEMYCRDLASRFEDVYVLSGPLYLPTQDGQQKVVKYPSGEFTVPSDMGQLIEDEDQKREQSNIPQASFNFINSIIGSGIIGMPYALKQAGFPMGVLLILIVALITDYSVILLIRGGNLSGTKNYQDLVRAAFGFPGFVFLSIVQFVYPFIAMISYNIITGDTITKVMMRISGVTETNILANRYFIICLCTLFVTLPLSLYRNVAKLAKASLFACLLVVFIIIAVIVRSTDMHIPPTEDAYTFAKPGFAQAVGIMAFAFVCHHNTFLIYGSLEEPTVHRWSIVTHISVVVSFIATVVFAACGYATFTGYTQGDVLENYCHEDDLINAARFCYGVCIMLTFPVECFVCREVIEHFFFQAAQPTTMLRHVIETVIIVGATLGISLATDCLGIVLELNGTLGATPLVFILPAACYMKLEEGKFYSAKKLPSLLIVVTGAIVMVIGFIMAVLSPQGCSHGKEMSYCHANDINATDFSSTFIPSPEMLTTTSSSPPIISTTTAFSNFSIGP
ncbi:putative sodium-coupled neutral amino acid transporter 11 isoform X3 [Branchiostoma floridae x Branchiostoma belcheri]